MSNRILFWKTVFKIISVVFIFGGLLSCQNKKGKVFFCQTEATFRNDDIQCFRNLKGMVYKNFPKEEIAGVLNRLIKENKNKIAVEILNDHKNITLSDGMGNTPLHIAIFFENKTILPMLLKSQNYVFLENKEKHLPIHVGVEKKNYQIISYYSKQKLLLGMKTKGGLTPLSLAAALGDLTASKILIAAGSDPFAMDKNGNNAIVHLAYSGILEKVRDFSKSELEKTSGKGSYPILVATQMARFNTINYLLDKKVKLDRIDSHGEDIGFSVVYSCDLSIVKKFHSLGVEFSEKNRLGHTVLHRLVGWKKVIKGYSELDPLMVKHFDFCTLEKVVEIIKYISKIKNYSCEPDNLGKLPIDYWVYPEAPPEELECQL